MQSIFDFLDFRLFISPVFLFVFYYLGALVMPLAGWKLAIRVKQKYWLVTDAVESGKNAIHEIDSVDPRTFDMKVLSFSEKLRFSVVAVIFFVLLEIMWRMMFEFLMAYFQIRDALVG
ncbi:MAG: DUF4282 domain-containing protein [Gammaproteobacteria bacterium]|nr:DUF4282 domain-containing protein [Gammaproteobacteria bacterium]